jgi:hypothetical protein
VFKITTAVGGSRRDDIVRTPCPLANTAGNVVDLPVEAERLELGNTHLARLTERCCEGAYPRA